MASARQEFFASISSGDRYFREDFDLFSAKMLQGADRDDAIDLLLQLLDDGQDPRVPRALAALGAKEHLTELRIAATLGQPRLRAESAIAFAKLGGDRSFAHDALVAVLNSHEATREGKVRAIIGLEKLGLPGSVEALVQIVLSDSDRNVRANAFDGAMYLLGLAGKRRRNSRLDALYQLLMAQRSTVRNAYADMLRDVLNASPDLPGWLEPIDVTEPRFIEVRQRLRNGRQPGNLDVLTSADAEGLDPASLLLLQAWAVHDLDRGQPGAENSARALGVRGL